MAGQLILVIEDERDIVELLKFNLDREGYRVESAQSGEDGLERARRLLPDLVLLDLMLPHTDGLEVCRALKAGESTASIPVVMLTAKGEETDVVTGLEVGADDYIAKPFSPKVLIARIRAVLRRRAGEEPPSGNIIRAAEVTIDQGRHEVTIAGRRVDLTPTEFALLSCLARRPGWVYSRSQLVDEVRGEETIVTDRAVDVQVAGLRKKLGEYGHYIETVRGVGYKFRES